MRAQAVLLIAICCAGPVLSAQQNSTIQRIKAVGNGRMPASHRLVTAAAMCDDSGNIYVRPFDPDKVVELASVRAPIQRITSEATIAARFSVTELPGGGGTTTYFVSRGKVYVPAGSVGDLQVVAFEPDGAVKSRTKLEVKDFFDVRHMGVFNSGEYLLVGTTGTLTGTSPKLKTPVTVVFAADGSLLKTIHEPEDEDAHQKAEQGDTDFVPCCVDSGNLFVLNADISAGSDGNLYLLHGGPSALVYAISPAGNVLRKFRVSGGSPATKPCAIRSYGDRLAIEFQRADNSDVNLISIVDFAGNPIAKYEVQDSTPNTDPILACYGSNGFTLVPRWVGDKPYFLTAKLP